MRSVAEITHGHDGSAAFQVPFNAGWVRRVKQIPPAHREWDPEGKTWAVRPPYVARIVRLTRETFAEVVEFAVPEVATAAAITDPFEVMHLQRTAPELVEGAYRILDRLHHPARGGDGSAMQQLNSAYSLLKTRVRR